MKWSSNKSVKKENIFFIMMSLFGDAQRAGICEGWGIDFRPPGYLKLNL
jgi:hypothetical protein